MIISCHDRSLPRSFENLIITTMGIAENERAERQVLAAPTAAKSRSAGSVPVASRVLALQRSMGNAAVTAMIQRTLPLNIRDRRGGRPSLTTDSDRSLGDEYMEMMKSPEFRKLDSIAAKHRAIRLIDSSDSGAIDYEVEQHAIRVPGEEQPSADVPPVKRPSAVVRSDLLWEMHNAMSRGRFNRADRLSDLATSVDRSPEGQYLARYYRAASALASEWVEWSNLLIFETRAGRIDADLGGGGQVEGKFAGVFDKPGEKWFKFDEYLKYMLSSGHTLAYDLDSDKDAWVGKEIHRLAYEKSASSMIITQRELAEFRSGRRRAIKNEAHNPFNNESLAERAARRAWPSERGDFRYERPGRKPPKSA